MDMILDAGSWKADSIPKLREMFGNFYVHAFEPNPLLDKYYEKVENVHLHHEAVWIEDTRLPFYYGENKLGRSGSIIEGKKNTTKESTLTKAIDFDAWIKRNHTIDDNLILKMDIEGAEYTVIPHMIAGGSIYYVKKLLIEWHWDRLPNVTQAQHQKLLKSIPIKVETWE